MVIGLPVNSGLSYQPAKNAPSLIASTKLTEVPSLKEIGAFSGKVPPSET